MTWCERGRWRSTGWSLPVWLDRVASPALMAALQEDPYSFLPALVKVQSRPGLLDLRFRSHAATGTSEATLYAGERAAVRLLADGSGSLTLAGPVKPVATVSPEGRVQAALCSRLDYAVLDRECAFRIPDATVKAAVLQDVQTPLAAVVKAVVKARASGALPTAPVFGPEADAIAVGDDGALEIIEIKCGDVTGRLGWTAAQVTFYANLFRRWLDECSSAVSVLRKMLTQRLELGLSPLVALREPVQIRPVIAIGAPFKNEAVARARAEILQAELIKAGIGWDNLVARLVEPTGDVAELDWF
jgi:hypothetical protein